MTIADAFRTVENAFMTDRDRLLQRQVLAAILSLVRALDGKFGGNGMFCAACCFDQGRA